MSSPSVRGRGLCLCSVMIINKYPSAHEVYLCDVLFGNLNCDFDSLTSQWPPTHYK